MIYDTELIPHFNVMFYNIVRFMVFVFVAVKNTDSFIELQNCLLKISLSSFNPREMAITSLSISL